MYMQRLKAVCSLCCLIERGTLKRKCDLERMYGCKSGGFTILIIIIHLSCNSPPCPKSHCKHNTSSRHLTERAPTCWEICQKSTNYPMTCTVYAQKFKEVWRRSKHIKTLHDRFFDWHLHMQRCKDRSRKIGRGWKAMNRRRRQNRGWRFSAPSRRQK